MRLKLERRGQDIAALSGKMNFEIALVFLAVTFGEFRLRIKQIHLTRSTVLEQTDHGVGVGASCDIADVPVRWMPLCSDLMLQQMRQRHQTEAAGRTAQESSAMVLVKWMSRWHGDVTPAIPDRSGYFRYKNPLAANSM